MYALLGLLSLASLALSTPAGAEPPRPKPRSAPARDLRARVDAIVAEEMAVQRLPAVIVAVVQGGEVKVKEGWGEKRRGTGERPDARTVFHIGSLSKSITAAGVMHLVQRGEVDLDAPMSRYVKQLPPRWREITVRQFLAHASGIPMKEDGFTTWLDAVEGFETTPLLFTPGEKNAYNNFNFAVAGQLVAAVSGRDFVDAMNERVWRPAGMVDTGWPATSANLAYGYQVDRRGRWDELMPSPRGPYGVPSGFISTTLDDLVRFHAALESSTWFSPALRDEMVAPYPRQKNGMALGWDSSRLVNGVRVARKGGAVQGFVSLFTWMPGRGDAVIVVANRKNDVDIGRLSNRIVEAAFGLRLK